jgi:RND family efflux transporter MFP subunit
MKHWMILSLVALTVVAVSCHPSEKPEPPTQAVAKVRLAPQQAGLGAGWVVATLSATQRAVLSTRMAASVKKVHVSEGQHVAAGALLVSLSDDDLQGGLRAAEAAQGSAEAHFKRIENLMKQNASTAAELDMARTALAQAQAAVASAKANIAYTQIRAPFAGIVQARRVNEGDFVGPTMPLVELEGQGAMELVGSVSESEARGLKLGQNLGFEVEGSHGEAVITGLSTGGDPISHRGTLRARITKAGLSLRSGAFARIRLPNAAAPTEAPERFIPDSARVLRGELNGVFVAREGKAELRWLSLGEPQGDRFPVRAGLDKDDPVIDSPGDLKDGQPIEVLR